MRKRAFPPLPTRPRLVLAVYPALLLKDAVFFRFLRANKWEGLAPLPQKKGDLVCRFFNDRLVVVGGMGTESMETVPQVIRQFVEIIAIVLKCH